MHNSASRRSFFISTSEERVNKSACSQRPMISKITYAVRCRIKRSDTPPLYGGIWVRGLPWGKYLLFPIKKQDRMILRYRQTMLRWEKRGKGERGAFYRTETDSALVFLV